mmetsp:Transcript_3934/g.9375  ORF Transcript_3934/g.9375 Transcript_3934/m.9375 type:complete len:227 (+) Transcript_3934:228-908(+)
MGAEAKQSKGKQASRGPKPKMTKEERRKKYTDIAKKRRDKQNGIRRRKNLVCYNCRQPGHNASECPNGNSTNNNDNSQSQQCTTILCYKCGSTEHALHRCPKRHRGDRNDLPYATCFICNQKGHLASACTQNKTGIYVNGGCCRRCGSTQHLATDCPEKKKNQKKDKNDDDDDAKNNADNELLKDVLQVDENPSSTVSKTKQEDSKKTKKSSSSGEPKKKKRVVNF